MQQSAVRIINDLPSALATRTSPTLWLQAFSSLSTSPPTPSRCLTSQRKWPRTCQLSSHRRVQRQTMKELVIMTARKKQAQESNPLAQASNRQAVRSTLQKIQIPLLARKLKAPEIKAPAVRLRRRAHKLAVRHRVQMPVVRHREVHLQAI